MTQHSASKKDSSPAEKLPALPVLSWRWVAATAVGTVMTVTIAAWLLLTQVWKNSDADAARAQLEAIRTALSLGVGAGGVFALWLAARRQRSTETQLIENARIAAEQRKHDERVATISEFDSTERRITELYIHAVEQLGSGNAAIRLGGLYALERLAQDHPAHRQTIVNVVCAYLRMPTDDTRERYAAPEREVRRTALQVLRNHLLPDNLDYSQETSRPGEYWPDMDIDLSGATLLDVDLSGCHLRSIDCTRTKFLGVTELVQAQFDGSAWFFETEFQDIAAFSRCNFKGKAVFTRSHFAGDADFRLTQFDDIAFFRSCQFDAYASFIKCVFAKEVSFEEVQYLDSIPASGELPETLHQPESAFDFTGSKIISTDDSVYRKWPAGWSDVNGYVAPQ